MTTDEIRTQYQAIDDRANVERNTLFELVLAGREFADGCRVRRIRYNKDESIIDDITGTVVGARVSLYDFTVGPNGIPVGGYPNIYYGVRVDSPADYCSHQSSLVFGVPMNQYEDFWQGDTRWFLLT